MELRAGLTRAVITNGRYERLLVVKGTDSLTNKEAGEVISDYIQMLDGALKAYFYASNADDAANEICNIFESYVLASSMAINILNSCICFMPSFFRRADL